MMNDRLPNDPDGIMPAHGTISIDAGHKVQDAIGRALRAHYVELVSEPIPDRLLKLLAELEAGERHHE